MIEKSRVILIAENDQDDRLFIKLAFEQSNQKHRIMFVADGEDLHHYLNLEEPYTSRANAPYPDLILLDLNMPNMDGREALRQLKAHPKHCSIPVIMLSTSQNTSDIDLCYQMGANSFIVKPNLFDDFAKIVKMLDLYWFQTVELPDS